MPKDVAAAQSFHGALGGRFRGCLVDMVNECLRYKPDDVSAEAYFAEQLEPILTRLAVDMLASNPEDPIAFVQSWVDKEELRVVPRTPQVQPSQAAPTPVFPLVQMTAWRDRTRAQEMQSELCLLRRRYAMLEGALQQTPFGRSALAAVKVEDNVALRCMFASCRCGEPDSVAVSHKATWTDAGASGGAAEVHASESMGLVLGALKDRGIASASGAFAYFMPQQGPGAKERCVERGKLLAEIEHLGVLQPNEALHLAECLDRCGSGRITFSAFRAMVARFLASSRDFHPSLSGDEFNTIMQRIRRRLSRQGQTLQEAFREWDVSGDGTLGAAEFTRGLSSLRLGLSGREAIQVFNTISTGSSSDSPISSGGDQASVAFANGRVVLAAFEMVVEQGARQGGLADWARETFASLRASLERKSVEAAARRHADAPACRHLSRNHFASLVGEADPAVSPGAVSRLWCVLEKADDQAEDAVVEVEELLRWMPPRNDSGQQVGRGLHPPDQLARRSSGPLPGHWLS